jgi:hypothetical protein
MLTEERLVQTANAPSPIAITLAGMLTETRLSQSENALSPIAVIPGGMTTDPPSPVYLTNVLSRISKEPTAVSCSDTTVSHIVRETAEINFFVAIILLLARKPAVSSFKAAGRIFRLFKTIATS